MPDMKYSDSVRENPIQNLVRISDQQNDAHSWFLFNLRCALRRPPYSLNNVFDTRSKLRGNSRAENASTVGGNLAQIAYRPIGYSTFMHREMP